ncbi:LysR family transcriptional regulator [Pedobacter frigiditerrae]|uniref:LysR family transcriptional regulator n=1 Tax=Pedobacter frigiditerrae TaxID=2530452 RepID=A0A4R0MYJ2_9SPHI|nr:LysR family transcriptional regulator [Pedobacter frigiditerrae]TCC92380.1 LysR family transcriptional regulator [Pedobacter frigiditerrae]
MNFNDLKIFKAVTVHNSFTRAAETMFTVQSNVTARIKILEKELGTELFKRNTRKTELTKSGQILMNYTSQILHLLEEARREISNSDEISGTLRLGCIETTIALEIPQILKDFSNRQPFVDIEFKSALTPTLINDVLSYNLDAAFVSSPVNIPELQQQVIKEEQLAVILPGNSVSLPSILKNKIPLKIIVFDHGCVFRTRLESWLNSKGIIQFKAIVVNSIEGIINFVEAGLGISILPVEIINLYYSQRSVKTLSLNKELATLTTILIYRNDALQSKALNAFVQDYKELPAKGINTNR